MLEASVDPDFEHFDESAPESCPPEWIRELIVALICNLSTLDLEIVRAVAADCRGSEAVAEWIRNRHYFRSGYPTARTICRHMKRMDDRLLTYAVELRGYIGGNE